MKNIFDPLRRILILQGLERAPGRELSNEMIQRLLAACCHRLSVAEVNAQIAWLESRGYAETERPGEGGFVFARPTRAGIDVALGFARAEGIDPPPRE